MVENKLNKLTSFCFAAGGSYLPLATIFEDQVCGKPALPFADTRFQVSRQKRTVIHSLRYKIMRTNQNQSSEEVEMEEDNSSGT